MTQNCTQHARTPQPAGAPAPSRTRIVPFAVGTAGIVLLLFTYYAHTWHSFTTAFDVCAQPFCDFVDYYYPMGETIFRTGLPVRGFLYSPFIAILLAIFPPLGLNASLVLWGILQILLVILYIFLFRRLVPAGLPVQLLFVALALSSFPLVLNQLGGQVSVFMIVALLGLLVLYERGHRAAAASLLAFAVSFKFYPIIFLAPFATRRDSRFLLFAAAACGTFLFVVPGLLLGVGDTLRFYGALLDSFRESGWVTANPHSQYFPHLVLRLADATGHDAQTHLSLLYWIAYGAAAANMGLIFLVQRARLRHANLWSFQLVFLTIPFVLKTSWPHDFVFLSFTQAFLVWRLLEGEKPAPGTDTAGKRSHASACPRARTAVTFFLLLPSIVFSNIVFFNLFGDFIRYGFYGFLLLDIPVSLGVVRAAPAARAATVPRDSGLARLAPDKALHPTAILLRFTAEG
ncbi:glycosyltransferase family 87 protein [Acidobacteriota bacterium]